MKKWLLAFCLFSLPAQASEVVGSAGYYGIIEPTISGVATGDLDLNGVYKLILDADADTHIKSTTDDTFELTIGGTARMTGTNSSFTFTVPFLQAAGSLSAPSYSWTGTSSNTGWYLHAADSMSMSLDGVARLMATGALMQFRSDFVAVDAGVFALGNISGGGSFFAGTLGITQGQLTFGVSAGGAASGHGNQIVITTSANYAKDHDHAAQTNPTLYVHSVTDPDSNNTQWISLTHDQTNGVLDVGLGFLSIPDGVRGARVIGTTVAEPFTCASNEAAGISVYVDDTDDNISGLECICIGTGDDAAGATDTWDWMRADDNATVCPFF